MLLASQWASPRRLGALLLGAASVEVLLFLLHETVTNPGGRGWLSGIRLTENLRALGMLVAALAVAAGSHLRWHQPEHASGRWLSGVGGLVMAALIVTAFGETVRPFRHWGFWEILSLAILVAYAILGLVASHREGRSAARMARWLSRTVLVASSLFFVYRALATGGAALVFKVYLLMIGHVLLPPLALAAFLEPGIDDRSRERDLAEVFE